jgi:hypothetical protein
MKHQQQRFSIIAAACAAVALAACGGGGGSGSTSATVSTPVTPSSSTMSGTVTGFGSIIVDGVRINDRAAVAGIEKEDGSVRSAEVKLGHHVEVEHDASLTAKTIQISSEVEGTVSAVGASSLTVMGQTVAINTDATAGPVTVFEAPYQKLVDIKVNDLVEIHGMIKVDSAGKSTIQATRIEKKISSDANRVRGTVTALSTSASTFKIGDLLVSYANAKVTPASVTLANGMEVAIWVPLNATSTGTAINASKVKIKDLKTVMQMADAKVGGIATKLDASAKTFVVDGVTVDASGASFEPSGKTLADIKEGSYVRVQGDYLADGSLKAKSIVLRALEKQSGQEVELHGSVLNFKSNADFTLRDVHVDASTATISCSPATLSNNLQIEVEGRLTAEGKVLAATVKCEKTQDEQSVLERSGVAAKIDLTTKTLTIGTGQETLSVQWSATTLFVGVEQSTLDGKTVKVEGVLSGGVFRATKIKIVAS